MIRQRALAWAAILGLIVSIQIAPLPARFSLSSAALAQDNAAAGAGDPTDLAIVALHCANAPDTEALTSFFSSGVAPTGCEPAVGVGIAVTEEGSAVSGSPFTTDVSGAVVVPVSLGAAIGISEDQDSLPAGYEPLTQEANGVPYANPVHLDAAVAGAAVLFVNVPDTVATTLAQGNLAASASEPTDLAVVALHCADAPAAETLTTYFSSGTPPSGCTAAEGVTIEVTENEKPLASSPFRTDDAGTLAVQVGLGSRVTVKENLESLPPGYEPLAREANGVPYANPVRLDSAVAGAAVLFVNVPTTVAARLNQGAPAARDRTRAASLDRTGCDPAYPEARTCIAPGRPLAAPCAITSERNFTVLAPDPRGLDADGDGIGCEPILPRGGPILLSTSANRATSGSALRPASTSALTVAASPARSGDGVRRAPSGTSRSDGLLGQGYRNRGGRWFRASERSSTGNVAIVSNPVFIDYGLWAWPDRHGKDDWFWRRDNHDGRFWPDRINVGNITVANSGGGNVAIASNPVVISNGVWSWPNHAGHDGWFRTNVVGVGNITVAGSGNGNVAIVSNPVFISRGVWAWPDRFARDGWSWRDRFGGGFWGRSSSINVGNVVVAGSGNGNIAIASNPVFISNGVWFWPGTIGVGNLTVARSGSGNVAIVSNPVFISSGVWFVPPDRHHDDHWLMRGERGHADDQLGREAAGQTESSDAELLTTIDDGASEAQPGKIEQAGISEQQSLTVNGELAVEPPPAGSVPATIDTSTQPPAELAAPAGDSSGGLPSDDSAAAVSDDSVASEPAPDVQAADTSAPDPGYVATDATTTDSSYVDSGSVDSGTIDAGPVASDPGIEAAYGATDSGYVDASYVEPVYVAQEPTYVEPVYVAPDPGMDVSNGVDAGAVGSDPGIEPNYGVPEPGYVDPGIDAGNAALEPIAVDAGYVDPVYTAPDPAIDTDFVASEPGYVDVGNSAPNLDLGLDAGNGGADAINLPQEPTYVEPSYVDAGNGNSGIADVGTIAPDLGMDVSSNGDAGDLAPDSGAGDIGQG